MAVLPRLRAPGLQPDRFALSLARGAGPAAYAAPALCPEIRLLAGNDLWAAWQEDVDATGPTATPPYWTIAWPGGQALARYILDHPATVAGRRVLDGGTGCGLVAIAAAIAGARIVVAVDHDPLAVAAAVANAARNDVADAIEPCRADLTTLRLDYYDVILAGDLWYERFAAARITTQLRAAARAGADVLIGDNARAYAPRTGLTQFADYTISADPRIEAAGSTQAYVARLHGTILT